jgi:hypothetical protein
VPKQLRMPKGEEWPDQRPADGRHARESGRAGAGQHPHQDGFYLIVCVMGGEDETSTEARSGSFEPGIAFGPCAGFCRISSELEPSGFERKLKPFGQGPNLIRHPAAVGMNAVVHVGHKEVVSEDVPHADQKIQQGNRVRPTGYRDQDWPGSEWQGFQMLPEAIEQGHAGS